MEKLYRFSPIGSKEELLNAIKHIHFACSRLCKQSLGKYLPVAGNVGVFCHYDDEYKFLTELRKELTEESDNWNQKYYRLHEPIVIAAKGDAPEATYTHLYIRRPDPYRAHVGDIDFVLEPDKYKEFKQSLLDGKVIKGARGFDRSDLDMIELYDPDIDALAYVSVREMTEKVRVKSSSTKQVEKKAWPELFQEVLNGKKTFDLRLNDFEIKEGDTLLLREWDPATKEYTGKEVERKVGYVGKWKIDELTKFWPREDIDKNGIQVISIKE